jgi:4-amino-4-deoxy-L-arabinose transferase-like glycosyltransferase
MKRFIRGQSNVKSFLPVIALALVAAANYSLKVFRGWERAAGWEYEWIGWAIAKGQGFSFPGNHRWLYADVSPDRYFPTAWIDPVYPFFAGVNFYLFGEFGKLSILMANVFFYFLTILVLFMAARRLFGELAAYIAVLIYLLMPSSRWVTTGYLGNSVFAGLLILLALLLSFWYLHNTNWKKAIPTGIFFGFMTLSHAGTLLLTPGFCLYSVITDKNRVNAVKCAVILCIFAGIAISPWTLRNYMIFGKFIAVRNGAGQILYVSNAAVGHTVAPVGDLVPAAPVPWRSDNFWHAWKQLMVGDKRRSLEAYAEKRIASQFGETYRMANEAGRDQFFMTAGKSYILENPLNTAVLSAVKAVHFFLINWPQYVWKIPAGPIVTLLAICGAVLFIKRREVGLVTVLLLSYAAPYTGTGPYFYRYRYPIEPLFILLAALIITAVLQRLLNKNGVLAVPRKSGAAS